MTTWNTYITQAQTSHGKFQRIDRLTKAYADRTHFFADNKYFIKIWLQYAELVCDKQDVFEFMLENKIGINDCQAVKKIAEFFELRSNNLENLRRADNIYRMALKQFDQSIEEAIENCQES